MLEHIITSNIMQHLDKHNILHDAQHGFRKHRSTETQHIQLIDNLAHYIDNRIQTDTILLYFQKALTKFPTSAYSTNLHTMSSHHKHSKTAQRANTTSAFLHRNIRACPRKTKHLAYTTLVRPILEYASIIWDPHTDSNTLKLETVQCRSDRRIMHNYNRHASVTTMLQNLDLPTLQQHRQHSKISMLYRIRHQLANIPTTTYIAPVIRNTQHYILPYPRTHVYKSSFFPNTIKLWNILQPAIINSTTIPQLRQALQSTPTSGRRGATLSA